MTRTSKQRTDHGVDPVIAGADAARALGHVPLRQRRSFECWQCGASGSVDHDGARIGTIFAVRCSR